MYTLTKSEIQIAEKVIRTLYQVDYDELPFQGILDTLEMLEEELEAYNIRVKLHEYAEKANYSQSEEDRVEARRKLEELQAKIDEEGIDLN